MKFRWNGVWLEIRQEDCERVVKTLAENGLHDGDAYQLYHASWTELAKGVPSSVHTRSSLMFKDDGTEVLAKMILV